MALRARSWLSLLAASTALAVLPAAAWGQTAIAPDVGAGLALGTTVAQAGRVFTVDGGTLSGANLFHSFSQFSLGQGDTAQWTRATGAASVRNVINRVTGGQASRIAGTLDSTALPNASFFFINPAGVVFTEGARVNVPAAAYFSTAGELRFADGGRFAVAAPNGSTLSMAAPESFGFVGGQGDIGVSGAAVDFASTSTKLSFVAGDVSVTGSRFAVRGLDLIAAGDGVLAVDLADPLAAPTGGSVEVRASTLNVTTTDLAGLPLRVGGGQVTVAASNLASDTGGAGRGGDLMFAADRLRVTADAFLVTSSRGAGAGGDLIAAAGEIEVDARGATTTTGLTSVATGAGAAGGIALFADKVTLVGDNLTDNPFGGAFVGSTVTGAGGAGDVEITAQSLSITNGLLSSATIGDGAGGDIRISADLIDLGNANLVTSGFGAGMAGDVVVDGGTILISGGSLGSTPGGAGDSGNLTITAATRLETSGTGFGVSSFLAESTAGTITIRAPLVFMEDSRIFTNASAEGGAGRLLIEAGDIVFDDVTVVADTKDGVNGRAGLIQLKATGDILVVGGQVRSNANGFADGGVVTIEGRNVQLENIFIQSDTIADGDAGRVSIKADALLLRNASVTSTTSGAGAGGDVLLDARTITLDTAAGVRSDATDEGNAGSVSITATTLDLLDGASITSRAQSGTGNAGAVRVNAGAVTLTNGEISSGTESFGSGGTVEVRATSLLLDGDRRGFTSINSDTRADGRAGDIIVDAKTLVVRNGAYISSDVAEGAAGNAGTVQVRSDDLTVANQGYISSDSLGSGDAGGVSITAKKLTVRGDGDGITYISSDSLGVGNAGTVTIDAGVLNVDGAGFISSDTYTLGRAGDIVVKADSITLANSGNIRSRTLSNGDAGNVEIVTKTLSLTSGAAISSEATDTSSGNAGGIVITADALTIGDQAKITTSTQASGKAGQLGIEAKTLLIDGGAVSSSAEPGATGESGAVVIAAETLSLLNGGAISTLSANSNPGGAILIGVTGDLLVDGQGSIISSENQAGNPMNGPPGSGPGPGGAAGNMLIGAGNLTVSNGGRISTNSFAGAAGGIAIVIERPGLLVLEGKDAPGVIQTSSGPGTGGQIAITDPLAIISNGGAILALGQQRGANVAIQSKYFINSTDRSNVVAVDGDIELQTGLYDVSSGVVSRDLSVLDASKVLRGQCPAARSTGVVSQLITRPVGPYARDAATPDRKTAAPGGCP